MIKHGVVMVTLLILTLSLLGVVSASDDITSSDVDLQSSLNHENTQIRVADSEAVSFDAGSLSDDYEGDVPVYSDSKEVKVENVFSNSIKTLNTDYETSISQSAVLSDMNLENSISIGDVELLENNEENIPISSDVPSEVIGDEFNDENYKFGQEITVSVNELYDFESADEILVIVEAGENEIDNVTTENIVNGINDASNGYITYGKGNLVKLSSIESGLINIAFFIKKGEFLTMVFYKTGDITPRYSGNVSLQNSASPWVKIGELLSFDGASSKSGSNGLPKGLLSFGENGFTCLTLEQFMVHNLLEYNLNGDGPELPLDDAGKYVIGVSGDADDDAFIWNAPDKSAYLAVDSNENKNIGLDMEDNTYQSGMITVMSYDQSNLKEMLENNLNPEESVMIETLYLQAAGEMTQEDIRQIGIDASRKALDYFKSQGIDVNKYYRNFYILTSAGHVQVNGLDTSDAIEGIIEVFGQKVSKNLMAIDTPLWKDLVFYFLWVNSANGDITSYGLKYVASTAQIVESGEVKKQGDAIAYAMGLYGKHPSPSPHHHKTHYAEKIRNCYVVGMPVFGDLVNNTNMTNTTNSSGLNMSDIKKPDSENDTIKPAESKGSPYNILYNFVAICMICVIFGASYSKR